MAGGRRNITRATPPKPPVLPDVRAKSGSEERSLRVPITQHVVLPDIPRDGELFFELLMTVYVCSAMGLQYLNLYRTIWWLPHSYTVYAMNLYLINTDVTRFVLTLLCRRFVWAVLKHLSLNYLPKRIAHYAHLTCRVLLMLSLVLLLSWFSYKIFMKHQVVHILYLYYPLVIYFIVLGPSPDPFWELIPEYARIRQGTSVTPRPVYHACSSSPELIRQEVELMKADFNTRIKQVLFNAVMVGYYVGIIPLFFAQSTLQFDWFWATQHAGFVFLSSLTLYAVYCLPPRYCDILHRCALHLGTWVRVDDRRAHISFNPWSRDQLWARGVLTKHCRELYRCDAVSAAAEPGNALHERFYVLFYNPSLICCCLLIVQTLMVTAQTMVLVRCSEWYQLLSCSLLLFINFYPLFKLSRDFLIMCKIYRAERLLLDKQSATS